MKTKMLFAGVILLAAGFLSAEEASEAPYYSITMVAGLPKPYGKSTLNITCSNGKWDMTREITSITLDTEAGKIPFPKKAFADLKNPSKPNLSFLEVSGVTLYIEFGYEIEEAHYGYAKIEIKDKKVASRYYTVLNGSGRTEKY